jgi:hypothetical protein
MLNGGFVAKANILNPMPSFLYVEAHIMKDMFYLWLTRDNTFFICPKLTMELGLADAWSR